MEKRSFSKKLTANDKKPKATKSTLNYQFLTHNFMDNLLEILKYTVPAIVAVAGSILVVKAFIDKETSIQKHEYVLRNQKIMTPVILQAYERVIMFLERISPANLISRVQEPGMTVHQLQLTMLKQIRAEYEHNISQQIYVTGETWELVRSSKESLIRLVNVAAGDMDKNAAAFDLTKAILDVYLKVENPPIEVAITKIKNEFYNNFVQDMQ